MARSCSGSWAAARQGLPSDSELPGRLTDRQAERWQDILSKDCAGMGWRSLAGHFIGSCWSSVILLEIHVVGVVLFPFECDSPRPVDPQGVAFLPTPESVKAESGNVQL